MANNNELTIPETFNFEDVQFSQDPVTKAVHCNLEPLVEVLRFNGIHAHLFRERPYFNWLCISTMDECYRVHLARGGKPNPDLDRFRAKWPEARAV